MSVRYYIGTSGYYSDSELRAWASKIDALARNLKAVYIYFNNDVEGYAVQNVRTLSQFLS